MAVNAPDRARFAWSMLATAWTYGAIYFDGPLAVGRGNKALAIAWVVLVVVAVVRFKGRRVVAWVACFFLVLIPWMTIQPSNDRDWKPEWARTCSVEVEGDLVTIHNFRNFDYGLDGTVTERWETRTAHLSNLQGIDLVLDRFGGDLIAHPLISFDFGPDGHVVLSVETRREVGESYSTFGGLYKMFELQYLFGDEKDFVRVRTNVRKSPVYLYRGGLDREEVRTRFLETVEAANRLVDEPRFYNVLSANCTTSLRAQTAAERRAVFDIRMLANGKVDELLYERGAMDTGGLSFPELREQARINEVALEAHEAEDFSGAIRENRVGFHTTAP